MTASTTVRIAVFDARLRWFGLDAVVTGVNALGYVTLGARLSEQLGGSSSTYRTVGGVLLLFAISVGVYAAVDRAPRRAGWWIVAANVAWVVGSLVVAAIGIGDFNGLGRSWIACQAVVVAAMTVMQTTTFQER